MFKAELHVHTTYSDGRDSVRSVLSAAAAKGLDIVAITDHDCVEGSLEARDLAAEEHIPLIVITGSEITTRSGHLLVYGIEENIDARMSMEESCRVAKELGGLSFLAHPFDFIRGGTLRVSDFRFADGVEVFNAKSYVNFLAKRFARKFGKPGIAGSDAHSSKAVGTAITLLSSASLEALLNASLVENRIPIRERLSYLLPRRCPRL